MAIFSTKTTPTPTGGTQRKDKSGDCSDICLERDSNNCITYDCPFYAIMGLTEICLEKCPT